MGAVDSSLVYRLNISLSFTYSSDLNEPFSLRFIFKYNFISFIGNVIIKLSISSFISFGSFINKSGISGIISRIKLSPSLIGGSSSTIALLASVIILCK